MKITVTSVCPTPQGVRFGLRVEHEKAGWVRFATTVLLVDALTNDDRRALTKALDSAAFRWNEDLVSEPLF